ncbi:MAG: hypothetical protein WCV90_01250 [Candidatus Woesearchaeota archaeon]|jgi:hypothetical protein
MTEKKSLDYGKTIDEVVTSGIEGYFSSWFNPLHLVTKTKQIHHGKAANLNGYVGVTASLAAYGYGWCQTIERIAEDSSNPIRYLPLAFNAVSAGIQLGWYLHKRFQIEQK